MKVKISKQGNEALTRTDVIVLLVILAIIALVIMLPMLGTAGRRAQRINCLSNLKQIGDATHWWAEYNGTNKSFQALKEARTGWLLRGNVAGWFQVMSNELDSPKILICPSDRDHSIAAINFQNDFNNSHISYFVGPDANETYPQMLLFGDSNLEVSNTPVKSGLFVWTGDMPVSWTAVRHNRVGNVAFADGSVSEVSNAGLLQALVLATNGIGFTNRLVIP